MEKHSNQAKLPSTKDYCESHLGLKQVPQRRGVNVASLRRSAAAYRTHDVERVKTKQRKYYTAEFRLVVLCRMQDESRSHVRRLICSISGTATGLRLESERMAPPVLPFYLLITRFVAI